MTRSNPIRDIRPTRPRETDPVPHADNRLATPSDRQLREAVREANRPERLVTDQAIRVDHRSGH
jgi:uncharacterized membrane protein